MLKRWAQKMGAYLLVFCMVLLFAVPPLRVQAAEPPEVGAGAYVLMDANTGQILASKNAQEMVYPASVTKIMTLGLILEQATVRPELLAEMGTASYRAVHELIYGSTHVALKEGDALTVQDLVYATQIDSANDAANVLAEHSDGTLEAFATRMNTKASELGLAGSQFTNPSGLPDSGHFTTAYDMAQITRWALSVPGFRDVFAATEYTIAPTASRAEPFLCQNDNSILEPSSGFYYPGVTGSKMGYTTDARYTLVTTAKQGDTELICVVMQCETSDIKYTSTQSLLDYGFGNFTPVQYPMQDVQPVAVPVYGGGSEMLGEIMVCGSESDMTLLLPNGTNLENVNTQYIVPDRYVIGQGFNPILRLTMGEGDAAVALLDVPLSWTGFDEIFAENTSVWQEALQEVPSVLWAVLLVMMFLSVLVLGRIIYVRYRRQHRRKRRLAEYQSRQPIRIEPRPEIKRSASSAVRQSDVSRARQIARQGHRAPPYVYGTEAKSPRRAGRMR